MKATRIKMKNGCGSSNKLIEIDSVYLAECKEDGFFKKENIYDFLINNPGMIHVDIPPFPKLIGAKSADNEKYVKSQANDSINDNLLKLPRE